MLLRVEVEEDGVELEVEKEDRVGVEVEDKYGVEVKESMERGRGGEKKRMENLTFHLAVYI